jgi:hypothetical protein
MKIKILSIAMAAGALLVLPIASRAAIIGSPHDFGTNSWSANTVCEACHIPHASLGSANAPLWNHVLPGGGYTTYSSPTFLANGGTAPPVDGPSLACLSCHDGTLAINQFVNTPYGGTGVTNLTQTGAVLLSNPSDNVTWGGNGVDLSHNHPISFVYDAALANLDGTLENPATYQIGTAPVYPNTTSFTNAAILAVPVPTTWSGVSLQGKTIAQALLWNNGKSTEMEYTSCHDPHKMVGSSPSSGVMIKISGKDVYGRGDLICRNCHLK